MVGELVIAVREATTDIFILTSRFYFILIHSASDALSSIWQLIIF